MLQPGGPDCFGFGDSYPTSLPPHGAGGKDLMEPVAKITLFMHHGFYSRQESRILLPFLLSFRCKLPRDQLVVTYS